MSRDGFARRHQIDHVRQDRSRPYGSDPDDRTDPQNVHLMEEGITSPHDFDDRTAALMQAVGGFEESHLDAQEALRFPQFSSKDVGGEEAEWDAPEALYGLPSDLEEDYVQEGTHALPLLAAAGGLLARGAVMGAGMAVGSKMMGGMGKKSEASQQTSQPIQPSTGSMGY